MTEIVSKMSLDIPITHINEIFYQVMDKDGDGNVSYNEFCEKLKQWEPRGR